MGTSVVPCTGWGPVFSGGNSGIKTYAAFFESVSVGAGPQPGVAARGAEFLRDGEWEGPEGAGPGAELWGQMQLEVLEPIPGPPPGCPLLALA